MNNVIELVLFSFEFLTSKVIIKAAVTVNLKLPTVKRQSGSPLNLSRLFRE